MDDHQLANWLNAIEESTAEAHRLIVDLQAQVAALTATISRITAES